MTGAQSTLGEDERLELAFDHDVRLIRDDGAAEAHRYRYEAPRHPRRYWDAAERKHARTYVHLQAALEGFNDDEVGRKGIPLEVARAGQEAIVAFLFGFPARAEAPRSIARRFDVERQTIYQYLSRIRSEAPEPIVDVDG